MADNRTSPEIDRKNRCFIAQVNALQVGKLVTNPRVIFTIFKDGEEHPEKFGDFDNPFMDTFDYIVHRAFGISLDKANDFYTSHNVILRAEYITNSEEYRVRTFKACSLRDWHHIEESGEEGEVSIPIPEKMYVVIHLFQGVVHEVKVYTDPEKARTERERKIIEEYGELVEEQFGDDEILMEEAEVVA